MPQLVATESVYLVCGFAEDGRDARNKKKKKIDRRVEAGKEKEQSI